MDLRVDDDAVGAVLAQMADSAPPGVCVAPPDFGAGLVSSAFDKVNVLVRAAMDGLVEAVADKRVVVLASQESFGQADDVLAGRAEGR